MQFQFVSFAGIKKDPDSIYARYRENGVPDDKQVEILHDLYPEYFQSRFRESDSKSSFVKSGQSIFERIFGWEACYIG